MERIVIKLSSKSEFGSKAKLEKVELNKWYKLGVKSCCTNNPVMYGKVVAILENGEVEVEKYFEMPQHAINYTGHKWYHDLPFAVCDL